ncbi:polysaccharide deacetylase family protein [Chitinophagaceae bacterium 26-R-25]|nr:polysaccharide deacetylase family protein [Chitinophagaceae bacterium 26-R-25]
MKYLEEYKELKKVLPQGLRGQLRSVALDALYTLDQIKGIDAALNKPRVQFLYIHHIFRDEEKNLEALMKKLSVNHTFLSHSEAVEKVLKSEIDKPYIAISSDDGFKNNIRAAEILNEYGAKACFFINPAVVEMTSYDEIKAHCESRLGLPAVEFMNWNDIERLQRMGHEMGSHTMSHIDVAKAEKNFFIDDCNETYEVLQKKCGEAKHFAFPYGRFANFDEKGRKAVFDAGFISCASAERGCHISQDRSLLNEELCIRRDHVIADWKLNHIMHFLISNANNATILNNLFPYTS